MCLAITYFKKYVKRTYFPIHSAIYSIKTDEPEILVIKLLSRTYGKPKPNNLSGLLLQEITENASRGYVC